MYLQYFGFSNQPFSDTPDVRLFWEDHCSQLIFKSLLQGFAEKSILQLVIAEPGLGKSVLCRRLLNSLRSHRSRYNVLFMPFPNLTVTELLSSAMASTDCSRHKVLIIDEAQALSDSSLRELMEALKQQDSNDPELQIVLFAQPELVDKLADPEFEQIELLVSKRFDLPPLTAEQTAAYINNRLTLTGVPPETLMNHELAKLAYKFTGGIPRLINTLMRKSLLHAYEDQSPTLSADHLSRAALSTAATVPGTVD
ncbi:MAG: AAA family ATPase [Pseudohongiella sp.]|nr:AAA family ATPase [Pseudohongiella sp.]MDO9520093.1 AAA family ATPase [Pseudohongiella sp.]